MKMNCISLAIHLQSCANLVWVLACAVLFFDSETVKSVKKLISLWQIAVNTKIHVQLMASDRFVVYIISRKWSECALQSWVGLLLTATDVLTQRGDHHHFHDWLFSKHQSLSTTVPLIWNDSSRLKPFRIILHFNKITKIVRALWLAERNVCMRVCKHGCGVKMFCFSRTNHASTNLKKFSSSKLDKFTSFTHFFFLLKLTV